MKQDILNGTKLPNISLGFLENGKIKKIGAREAFAGVRAVAIGVPGAFTPVCTQQHIPDFVSNAKKLRKNGFGKLVCIAPNDPFVLEEWARRLDPDRQITFLSDGNLAFVRALGLSSKATSLFLGERSERYLMVTQHGAILRFRLEPNILTFSCTRAEDALKSVQPLDESDSRQFVDLPE